MAELHAKGGIEYATVAEDYLHKRQLKKGAAGWMLLAGLGVSYVISGDYAGWNFGLAQGGFDGMFIATLIMGTMYVCMVLSLAEEAGDPARDMPRGIITAMIILLIFGGLALVIPGLIGFLLSLTGEGDLMITMAVFGATIACALMTFLHMVLRHKEADLEPLYRTPGGTLTSGIAFVLSIFAFASTFFVSLAATLWSALFYAIMIAYFALYSRHHLVASALEEKFEAIALAEQELA